MFDAKVQNLDEKEGFLSSMRWHFDVNYHQTMFSISSYLTGYLRAHNVIYGFRVRVGVRVRVRVRAGNTG